MTDIRKTALITGSGRNIGRATALALAAKGHNVVLNGSRDKDACEAVAAEAAELGVKTLIAMGDVGKAKDCSDIAGAALDEFGSVDILVNNAAIRPESSFLDMSEEEWNRVLAVDMSAAFWLARACLPGMIDKSWGRIVNVAGMNAIHGYKGRAHVSVAKHAAWGLTKALAKEFGDRGISTNIVSPGPIAGDHPDNPDMVAHIAAQTSKIPLGRLGLPEEVAAAIALLASDEGAFINGQLIQVNGGTQT
ncbi:MAG: SDR family oxidoreductase [Hyphomicrobiaceae bacterium]|nr:SDR family oxidoreductase [Hyphomicrobiaceae bacterium]